MTSATERWLAVPGWEGLYEVSDLGRVRSLPHQTSNGLRGGKILKPWINKQTGYLMVSLCREGSASRRTVHSLVLLAFAGPLPEGQVTRHLDGNPYNNRWAPGSEEETKAAGGNLIYGTYSENEWDKIRHGTHQKASLTRCVNGHEYTPENTRLSYYPDGSVRQRHCKTCMSGYRRTGKERRDANPERCKEDDCDDPIFARKMCSMHYQRWYREQPGNDEHMRTRKRNYDRRKRSEKVQTPE